MPYNESKDLAHVVAQTTLHVTNTDHYFEVFLWNDIKAMQNEACNASEKVTIAVVNHAPTEITIFEDGVEREDISNKLGEVHFIKDEWDFEVLSHELLHALWQRLRHCDVNADDVVWQKSNGSDSFEDSSLEEIICYEFGRWVQQVAEFLWNNDPNPNWEYVANK